MDFIIYFRDSFRLSQQALLIAIPVLLLAAVIMYAKKKTSAGHALLGSVLACLIALFGEYVWFMRRETVQMNKQIDKFYLLHPEAKSS